MMLKAFEEDAKFGNPMFASRDTVAEALETAEQYVSAECSYCGDLVNPIMEQFHHVVTAFDGGDLEPEAIHDVHVKAKEVLGTLIVPIGILSALYILINTLENSDA